MKFHEANENFFEQNILIDIHKENYSKYVDSYLIPEINQCVRKTLKQKKIYKTLKKNIESDRIIISKSIYREALYIELLGYLEEVVIYTLTEKKFEEIEDMSDIECKYKNFLDRCSLSYIP